MTSTMPLDKTETLRVRSVVDATRLSAWLRSGEGIGWLAAGTIYQTLSIECPCSIFFWHVLFVIIPFFWSFLFCFCFVFCSHWSVVDFPLIFSCPADHIHTGLATTYITGYG